jgi:hypothetical protein
MRLIYLIAQVCLRHLSPEPLSGRAIVPSSRELYGRVWRSLYVRPAPGAKTRLTCRVRTTTFGRLGRRTCPQPILACSITSNFEALTKEAGIHSGKWALRAHFGCIPGNFGPSADKISPGLAIALLEVGVIPAAADHPEGLVVDAAKVNPARRCRSLNGRTAVGRSA